MTHQILFSVGKSCLPIALVAFSIAFGAPAVHAQADENAASWREVADPIINTVHSLEARFASIEASVAQFASSFTTQQLNTRQLCVSDETGAQTCLTKAQLDALLAKMAQAAVEAPAEPPAAEPDAPAAEAEAPLVVVEPPAVATESQDSATAEPAPADETAVATAPVVEPEAGSKEEQSADLQPTAGDTPVVSSSEPGTNPAEPIGRDDESRDHEPATTNSVTTDPSRNAIVSYPEVDVSAPKTSSANE